MRLRTLPADMWLRCEKPATFAIGERKLVG